MKHHPQYYEVVGEVVGEASTLFVGMGTFQVAFAAVRFPKAD